jgi:hypothetical protein
MTVKELIEELQKIENKNLNVYLSDNDLDKDIFFYQTLDVKEFKVENEKIVSILFRN